MHLIMKPCSTV